MHYLLSDKRLPGFEDNRIAKLCLRKHSTFLLLKLLLEPVILGRAKLRIFLLSFSEELILHTSVLNLKIQLMGTFSSQIHAQQFTSTEEVKILQKCWKKCIM